MNNTLEQIKTKFLITQEDLANIKKVGSVILAELPALSEEFYTRLPVDVPNYKALTLNASFLAQAKEKQISHWKAFFTGALDENYILDRQQAGHFMVKFGLPLESYYSSVLITTDIFENAFLRLDIATYDILRSYHKLLNMDIAIVVETYSTIIQNTLKEQNNSLSTPVAELWDGILFLPLVGIIDSKRAQDIMLTMLNKVASSQSKVFILDISGVGVIDTAVANHLIKVTKATKLMGCVCTISGISPAVAQTMVELGIQIDEISTTSTMKDALQQALKRTNALSQLIAGANEKS